MIKPRWYQMESVENAVNFFHDDTPGHEFQILPTGSGKSVVIANIAKELTEPTLVLQPSKEILLQNYAKFIGYGYEAAIYSASAGQKYIDNVTFATIGSIINKKHLFRKFRNVIIDECHLVNPEEGMYQELINAIPGLRVLGLTATPYRLTSSIDGAVLNFLNRTEPRIFSRLQYFVQNGVLFDEGHLAPLKYFDFNVVDRSSLEMNKAGSDFTEASLRSYYRKIGMANTTIQYALKVLEQRKNVLVFVGLLEDAYKVAAGIPGAAVVSGDTPNDERAAILKAFKEGKIRCVVNVKVLDTGFDYPGLEAVLIARSTMSLAVYYQIVGRVMRIFQYPDGSWKEGWVVDLGGNRQLFGKIETMEIRKDSRGQYAIWNEGRQLTDVSFSKS